MTENLTYLHDRSNNWTLRRESYIEEDLHPCWIDIGNRLRKFFHLRDKDYKGESSERTLEIATGRTLENRTKLTPENCTDGLGDDGDDYDWYDADWRRKDDYTYDEQFSIGDYIECEKTFQSGHIVGIIKDWVGKDACYKIISTEYEYGIVHLDYVQPENVTFHEFAGTPAYLENFGYRLRRRFVIGSFGIGFVWRYYNKELGDWVND